MNVAKAKQTFATYLFSSGLSPLSQKSLNWDMSQFALRYGSWDVEKIQVDHIANFLKSYKKQGKAPASVNRMKSTLKRFFTYLLECVFR